MVSNITSIDSVANNTLWTARIQRHKAYCQHLIEAEALLVKLTDDVDAEPLMKLVPLDDMWHFDIVYTQSAYDTDPHFVKPGPLQNIHVCALQEAVIAMNAAIRESVIRIEEYLAD